jgi:hypothetical protein
MSFLGCKLLGVLSWPTIVLYRRGASLRRILPMVLAVLGLGLLLALGFDVWMPIRREAGGWSDGNAWFLLATIFPSVYEASAVDLLAPAAFLLAYGLGTIRFLRGRGSDSAPAGSSPNAEREFDRATAHLAWAMVAFLVFSKKTMGMYPPMALPFVVHTLLSRDGDRLRVATLFPILLIGATATVFPNMNWLGEFVRSRAFLASGDGALLLVAQVAKLVALAAMGRAAWTLLGSRDLGRAPSVR